MTPNLLKAIVEAICTAENAGFEATEHQAVSGGDINRSFRVSGSKGNYFVKVNEADLAPMMRAECFSLGVMAASNAIAVPRPVTLGEAEGCSFLVLEHHVMSHRGDGGEMGRRLAQLHQTTSDSGRFGWRENNFIGSSPQQNTWCDNWCQFWLNNRLQPQLKMAYTNGHREALAAPAAQLEAQLPEILADHQPRPSLLHGDLWGGNAAFLQSGQPIIYDPASYYGDRETDIALTELFGGFSSEFYEAYQKAWPLDDGYRRRKQLYNLYHLLNHLNLFGAGYLGQCRSVMQALLHH